MQPVDETHRRFFPQLLLILLGLSLIFTMATLFTGRALAQAKLATSDPADGASVPVGVTSIVITFTEAVSVDQSSAQLAEQGQQAVEGVTTQVSRSDPKVMMITTSPLQEGRYTVRWHAVTQNSNALTDGQINFTVGNPPPAAESTPTPQPPQPTATSPAPTAIAVSSGSGSSSDGGLLWILGGIVVVLLGVVGWQAAALRRRSQGSS